MCAVTCSILGILLTEKIRFEDDDDGDNNNDNDKKTVECDSYNFQSLANENDDNEEGNGKGFSKNTIAIMTNNQLAARRHTATKRQRK